MIAIFIVTEQFQKFNWRENWFKNLWYISQFLGKYLFFNMGCFLLTIYFVITFYFNLTNENCCFIGNDSEIVSEQ